MSFLKFPTFGLLFKGSITLLLPSLLFSASALAKCLSLIKGPVIFDVQSCGLINAEESFQLRREQNKDFENLPANVKEGIYATYRGLLIRGMVAKSEAIRVGIDKEKGALVGTQIPIFVPPGTTTCKDINGQRLGFILNQVCCEGSQEAPCLLGMSYTFKKFQALGESPNNLKERNQKRLQSSPELKAAQDLLAKKDYTRAVKAYEALRTAKLLDTLGLYQLGFAYNELSEFKKATVPLKQIYEASLKRETWADEARVVRKAVFLLARCYAKLRDPDRSILILNGYLLDPVKHRAELKSSLTHKDFGWISSTDAYIKYKEEVDIALARKH